MTRWLTGYGFAGRSPTFSSRARRSAGSSSRPTSRLWPSGLISRSAGIGEGSRSATGVFTEVVVHVGAARGTASGRGGTSRWPHLHVNREDPVELALAADLQKSALAHVVESSCGKYTCQFNMFLIWCDALAEPRATLPASDGTVTMYLQSMMNNAKTFAPVRPRPPRSPSTRR